MPDDKASPPVTPDDKRDDDWRDGQDMAVLGHLQGLIGFHLRMAHVAVYRDFSAVMAKLDLTQKQAATLELIAANPGVPQVSVAATLGTDRATMMAIIDRLDDRGLITRKQSTRDRRRQELRLTDAGSTLLKDARALIGAHEARLFSAFTPEEVETLTGFLKRIYR